MLKSFVTTYWEQGHRYPTRALVERVNPSRFRAESPEVGHVDVLSCCESDARTGASEAALDPGQCRSMVEKLITHRRPFALVSPEVGQVDGDGHVRAMHGRGQAGPFDPRLHVFFGEA